MAFTWNNNFISSDANILQWFQNKVSIYRVKSCLESYTQTEKQSNTSLPSPAVVSGCERNERTAWDPRGMRRLMRTRDPNKFVLPLYMVSWGHLDSALTPRHPSNSIQLIAVTMAELSPFPICGQKSDSHTDQPLELCSVSIAIPHLSFWDHNMKVKHNHVPR